MKNLEKEPITQEDINQKVRQTMQSVIYHQLIVGVILISILILSYFYFPFSEDLNTLGNRIGSMIGAIIVTCIATIKYHCMYQRTCHEYQQEFHNRNEGGGNESPESSLINQSPKPPTKGATDMTKYKLLKKNKIIKDGIALYRIQCVRDFMTADGREIKAGDLGGYLSREYNLSHYKKSWVDDNATVSGDAEVTGNALVCDNACITGNAYVFGNALIHDHASISDDARVSGNAEVGGDANISDEASVSGDAQVCGNARIFGNARVLGDVRSSENATISGNAFVFERAIISGNAKVYGHASISGKTKIQDSAEVCGNALIGSNHHLFTTSPIGEKSQPMTIFQNNLSNIEIVFAGKLYSVCEFHSLVEGWSPHFREIAKQAVEMAKKSINGYG